MKEFKVETDHSALRKLYRRRLVTYAPVALCILSAITVFVLRFRGILQSGSLLSLVLLEIFSLSAVLGIFALVCIEALRYAERKMIFILTKDGIRRVRPGYPDRMIRFSEINSLYAKYGRLVIKRESLPQVIAIPPDINDFDVLKSEIVKHCSRTVCNKL